MEKLKKQSEEKDVEIIEAAMYPQYVYMRFGEVPVDKFFLNNKDQ